MSITFHSVVPLRQSRVHEICGAGATGFAATACAQSSGALLWIRENWRPETHGPVGLSRFFDPARLLMAQAKEQIEVLAVAEESLRDGSLPLVVMELGQPLSLTAGRRQQLAAKAGGSTGLCMAGADMGSNAAETRWNPAPLYDPVVRDSTLMRWKLIQNKSATLRLWDVRWDHTARRLDVVSPPVQ